MDRRRLKNIILIVLAAVNLCFLLLVLSDRQESAAARRAARQALEDVYRDYDVVISPEVELYGHDARVYRLYRNLELERRRAGRLLGDITVLDEGGNIFNYIGERGQSIFRGTGEFAVMLEAAGGSMRRETQKMLKRLDIETLDEPIEDGDSLVYSCAFGGVEIYNCRISFAPSGSSQYLISGERPFDSASPQDTPVMDALSAMVSFLSLSAKQGYVYRRISDLDMGYAMRIAVSGECLLEPVWRITTDTGEYYINGATGETIGSFS